jgi:hypothetical protein
MKPLLNLKDDFAKSAAAKMIKGRREGVERMARVDHRL